MKCEQCKDNDATVHLAHVKNGVREEHHLCESCAEKSEHQLFINKPFDLWNNDFFKNLVSPYGTQGKPDTGCPVCGMNYSDFNRSGKFGCSSCYSHFHNRIIPMLERLQGSTEHNGKVPTRGTGVFTTSRQVQRLKQQLRQALQKEEYERAAELRDEIYSLESNENKSATKDGEE